MTYIAESESRGRTTHLDSRGRCIDVQQAGAVEAGLPIAVGFARCFVVRDGSRRACGGVDDALQWTNRPESGVTPDGLD